MRNGTGGCSDTDDNRGREAVVGVSNRRRSDRVIGVGRISVAGVLTVLWAGVSAALPVALATAGAQAPQCRAVSVEQLLPAPTPLLDFAENLGYDAHGNLWVSRVFRNVVQRYDSGGRVTAEVPVESPGAIRSGPDGALYVVYGDSTGTSAVTRPPES